MSLNLIEKYFYYRNRERASTCVVTGIKVDQPISQDQVSLALKKLVSLRRSLRLNVVGSEVKEINWDVSSTIKELQVSSIAEAVSQAHTIYFETNSSAPLWNVFLVNSNWILFAFDHLFYDGTTGILVLEDLLLIIQGEEITPDLDVSDAYEKHIRPPVSFALRVIINELCAVVKSYLFGVTTQDAERMQSNITDAPAPFHILQLSKTEMSNIKQFTSKEKITFTTLVSALGINVIGRVTGKSKATLNIPVNNRRFLGQCERAYGNIVSAVNINESTLTPWDDLKKNLLISRAAMRESAFNVGMLAYVNPEQYVKRMVAQPPDLSCLEISNIGMRRHIGHVAEYLFSQPKNAFSKYVINSIVSSPTVVSIVVTSGYGQDTLDKYFNIMSGSLREIGRKGATMTGPDCLKYIDCHS